MHKTERETLLSSSCVCPGSVEVQHMGLKPQADPQLGSGLLCVSLAGQQTKYPSRDVMSAPMTVQRPKRGKKVWHVGYLILHISLSNYLQQYCTVVLRPCQRWLMLEHHSCGFAGVPQNKDHTVHKPFEFHIVVVSPSVAWSGLVYHHPMQLTLKAV